jgi:hypothetical protein
MLEDSEILLLKRKLIPKCRRKLRNKLTTMRMSYGITGYMMPIYSHNWEKKKLLC